MPPPTLVPMRYACTIHGSQVAITRYDNHGGLLPDGDWWACRNREWYALWDAGSKAWRWEYKVGTRFPTPEQARDAAVAACQAEAAAKAAKAAAAQPAASQP